MRSITGVRKGVLYIAHNEHLDSDGDSGDNPRLICNECATEFELPSALKMDFADPEDLEED
jgi:hypothetical protein